MKKQRTKTKIRAKKSPKKTDFAYDPTKIEKKWQKKWAGSKIYASKETPARPSAASHNNGGEFSNKFYVLDMFPYPSGEGLHVGHPKGYIATDIVSRYQRMHGKNVLHPMGFDAFGLPAENYAIKTKTNPAIAVKKNVDRYKKQLEILGFDYDWSREVNTTDPNFYKWTQWTFLQMLKSGLAYESYEPVNWCPTDKTVLANEDVENGRCERCGTPVEKKPLRQWVLKITDYADRLLKDLDMTNYVMPKFVDTVNVPRPNLPFVERHVAHAIVFDPKNKKYLIIRNKKHGWDTVIIGGIEKGESLEETARREVKEETGYIDLDFKRVLGGVTEAKYFAKHKGENRVAYAQAVYFELKSDKRVPIADGEDKDDEVLWIDEKDFVPGKMINSELPVWLERLKNSNIGNPKPLLEWPESIKEAQRNWIGRSEGAEIDFRLKFGANKIRFVILHGFEGGANKNFIPWLKKELENRGHEVVAPELPNTNDPKEIEQVQKVIENCKLDEHTVVIGHSLGAITAIKAIMKLNKPISGLVIVAAAIDPKFPDAEARPYAKNFKWDIDYNQIKKLTGGKIAVLSDTKENLRSKYLKFLAEKLSAKLVEVEAKEEHFCANKEPAILDAVTAQIKVFTTRPDTLFGVTYVVLAPEHFWVKEILPVVENRKEVEDYINRAKNETEIERTDAKKEKTGVELKGVKAVNPVNGEEVPVWIADYVLPDYGTGAVMAVPAHDERDWEFAKKFDLAIREVVSGGDIKKTAYVESGVVLNSRQFSGKDSESVKKEITDFAGGKWVTKYKLRDWVFSRQRYWGEPIPVIHCEKCGVVPVPEKDLPVKLPKVKHYEPTGTGESPLAAIKSWVNVKCPKCKGPAKRETNTMPQWAGSSWYYIAYCMAQNLKSKIQISNQIQNPKLKKEINSWLPVDLYVGGAEHATRHLIYARFWHKFLYDIGIVNDLEPFKKLQSVGLIMGEDGRKMSKRFGNVVNPDDIVKTYGADTLRIYEMFMGPFDQQIAWSTQSMVGARRFIERVWKLFLHVDTSNGNRAAARGYEVSASSSSSDTCTPSAVAVNVILNQTINKVTNDIKNLRFNTAISALMIAVNELEKYQSIEREHYETVLKLLAPFAPHVTEELWYEMGNKKSIHISEWPQYDAGLVGEEKKQIIVQVNGKVRASFEAVSDQSESDLENAAKQLDSVQKWLQGKTIKKVIVIKDKLVSIVVA